MKSLQMFAVVAIAVATASACGAQTGGPSAPSSTDPQVQEGFAIATKQTCFGCHKVQGKGGTSGPSFDSANSQVKLASGETVTIDAGYLKRAITDPDAQIVQGYPKGVMSAALNARGKLSDDDVNALVAYLQSARH